ncbi:hypothetical protein E4U16_000633 [Claviceps sp. LM84 group G4]|nr:hypothetical protein E4U16_000633 [Claviceps sp. LM84 group G4]
MNRLKLQTRWKRSAEASARLRRKKAIMKRIAENLAYIRDSEYIVLQAREKERQAREKGRQLCEKIEELKRQIEIKKAQEYAETVGSGFGTDTPSRSFTSEAPYDYENEDTLPSLKALEASLPTVEQHSSILKS